jgi:aminoglycoside/choline kinase family phosphotransferase
MSRRFPIEPSQVTAEWIDAQLRTCGAITTANVTSIESEPLGEGVGMMALLSRITVNYDQPEAGAPATVVAKFAIQNENRVVGMAFRVYEREALFLRDLAAHSGVPLPAVYAVEIDLASGDNVILMEDIGDYRMGDQVEGCDLETAKIVLDAIAPVHAAFWQNVDQPILSFVPHVDGEMQTEAMSAGPAAGWDPCVERFPDTMTPLVRAHRDKFLSSTRELHARMGRLPQTLCHGDCRLDNMMFAKEPGHHPVIVLDWQGVIISSGLQDVGYLLTQNLSVENRRKGERDLVAHYHSRLVEHGVTGYTLEQCWEDYRLAALYLFVYALVIGGTLDPSNDRGRAFMSSLLTRATATIEDLDLFSLL